MATQFPTNLDNFTNPLPGDKLNSPSHSTQHTNANDAIEAIEAVIGVTGSTDPNTITGSLSNKVPYTGATANVNLGENGISSGFFQADLTPSSALQVGRMQWNDQDGTMEMRLKGNNVTLQIGQEQLIRVVNKTGADLLEANYQCVKISGAQGQRPKVALAQANNDANSADTIGLVTETIADNQEGFVTDAGIVSNINTTGSLQGETWIDGDVLYLSGTTAGRLTKVKPQAPIHGVIVGFVIHAHATQGKIYVKVDNGYELDELHNVRIVSPTNNQILQYTSATGLWENKTVSLDNVVYTTGDQTIGGTKTFSSTITGSITGNAGTVTNGVYTTGDQTIGGTKTFSSTISGSVSGNAGTVTNGVYTTGDQTIGGTKTFSSEIVGTTLRTSANTALTLVLQTGTGFSTGGSAIALRGSTTGYNNNGMEFYAGNSERMRLDSAGNLGIGTTSPTTKLQIGDIGATDATFQGRIKLEDTSASLQSVGGLEYATSTFGAGYGWKINSIDSSGVHLVFGTRQNSANWTEAMRLDSSGKVLIGAGATASLGKLVVSEASSGTAVIALESQGSWNSQISSTSAGNMIFSNGTNERMRINAFGDVGIGTSSPSQKLEVGGSILASGNVTAYSDIRVKDNVESIEGAIGKLNQIRGVTYTRTDLDDKQRKYAGVIAQEIEQVLPEAVFDNGKVKAVDYNATIALLIEAVKEQQKRIDKLETLLNKGN